MRMNEDNRGLSLVELIVVIAIMAVMIGIGAFSLSFLFGSQAKGCAQKVSAKLNETKTGSMSRFDETMTLRYWTKNSDDAVKTDGYYTENKIYTIDKNANSVLVADSEIRRMGSGRVVIKVYLTDGNVVELGQTRSVTIRYDRSTGALEPVMVDGTLQANVFVDKITFSSGMRTYTITMVKETGKHTLQG